MSGRMMSMGYTPDSFLGLAAQAEACVLPRANRIEKGSMG